jgi:hypothetical protein
MRKTKFDQGGFFWSPFIYRFIDLIKISSLETFPTFFETHERHFNLAGAIWAASKRIAVDQTCAGKRDICKEDLSVY